MLCAVYLCCIVAFVVCVVFCSGAFVSRARVFRDCRMRRHIPKENKGKERRQLNRIGHSLQHKRGMWIDGVVISGWKRS